MVAVRRAKVRSVRLAVVPDLPPRDSWISRVAVVSGASDVRDRTTSSPLKQVCAVSLELADPESSSKHLSLSADDLGGALLGHARAGGGWLLLTRGAIAGLGRTSPGAVRERVMRSREDALQSQARAGMHHRCPPGVDGRDDLLGGDPL